MAKIHCKDGFYTWDGRGYVVVAEPFDNKQHGKGIAYTVKFSATHDSRTAILWANHDGNMTLEFISKPYMGESEARAVHLAFVLAFKDLARKRAKDQRKFASDKVQKEWTEGHNVDLSRRDTIKILKSCKWRKRKSGGVEINYKGEWWHLCRTDLIDDVCTWTSYAWDGEHKPFNVNHLNYYAKTVAFGARLKRHDDRGDQTFAIIDAVSDH